MQSGAGVGTVGVVLAGVLIFGEHLSVMAIIAIGLDRDRRCPTERRRAALASQWRESIRYERIKR